MYYETKNFTYSFNDRNDHGHYGPKTHNGINLHC